MLAPLRDRAGHPRPGGARLRPRPRDDLRSTPRSRRTATSWRCTTRSNIEQRLRRELGCAATIHMDPIVTDDKLTAETRERVAQLVRGIDEHITIHDFRMVTGPTHTNVIFDAVVPFKFRLSDHEVEQEIQAAVQSGSTAAILPSCRSTETTPSKGADAMTEEIRKAQGDHRRQRQHRLLRRSRRLDRERHPRLPQRGRTLPPAVERPARNDPEPHLLRTLSREILRLLPRKAPLPRREAKRRAS